MGVRDWAHRLMGAGRWWWWLMVMVTGLVSGPDDTAGGSPTRSHDGHMVRVVGGAICMYS